MATSCEELTHWKRFWCWEGLGAGGEGDDRVWDGWIASPTRYTWVWVNSGSWWWTGRPGVLRFMGLQIVGYDWSTELNWTEQLYCCYVEMNSKWLADGWTLRIEFILTLEIPLSIKFANRTFTLFWKHSVLYLSWGEEHTSFFFLRNRKSVFYDVTMF